MQTTSIIAGMIITSIFLYSGFLKMLKKPRAEAIRKKCNASSAVLAAAGGIEIFAAVSVLAATFFNGAVDWLGFFGAIILIALTLILFYFEVKTQNDKKKLLLLLAIISLCMVFLVSVAMR